MRTDIHTETAKKMFGTNNITPETRLAAKRRNFLDIYGRHNVSIGDVLDGNKELDKKEMEELMKSFDMSEIENLAATMYERACEIRDLCDSDFASDAHITEMSEKFKADFGCNWTEILN